MLYLIISKNLNPVVHKTILVELECNLPSNWHVESLSICHYRYLRGSITRLISSPHLIYHMEWCLQNYYRLSECKPWLRSGVGSRWVPWTWPPIDGVSGRVSNKLHLHQIFFLQPSLRPVIFHPLNLREWIGWCQTLLDNLLQSMRDFDIDGCVDVLNDDQRISYFCI